MFLMQAIVFPEAVMLSIQHTVIGGYLFDNGYFDDGRISRMFRHGTVSFPFLHRLGLFDSEAEHFLTDPPDAWVFSSRDWVWANIAFQGWWQMTKDELTLSSAIPERLSFEHSLAIIASVIEGENPSVQPLLADVYKALQNWRNHGHTMKLLPLLKKCRDSIDRPIVNDIPSIVLDKGIYFSQYWGCFANCNPIRENVPCPEVFEVFPEIKEWYQEERSTFEIQRYF